MRELHPHERVRLALARALVAEPRLLLIDDPALEVGVLEADHLHELLRTLAAGGIAVLATVTDFVAGARILTISRGELREPAKPAAADVIELKQRTGR